MNYLVTSLDFQSASIIYWFFELVVCINCFHAFKKKVMWGLGVWCYRNVDFLPLPLLSIDYVSGTLGLSLIVTSMYVLYYISSKTPVFRYFDILEFGMHFITDVCWQWFYILVAHEMMVHLLIHILNICILNSITYDNHYSSSYDW